MAGQSDLPDSQQLFQAIQNNDIAKMEIILHKNPAIVNAKHQMKVEGSRGIRGNRPVDAICTYTPLIEACRKGSLCAVQILLKNGADVEGTGYLEYVNRHYPTILPRMAILKQSDTFYGSSDDIFPLFIASREGFILKMKKLLKAGAPINQTNAIGQSSLHAATFTTNVECTTALDMVKILLANGANVNLKDFNGKTPLHYACEYPDEPSVKALLKKGADISVRDSTSLSPLEIAAQTENHNYKVIKTIVSKCDFKKCNLKMKREIIEAYEASALTGWNSDEIYESLRWATQQREKHNLPKNILEPVECYGFVKEWETMEELDRCKNDQNRLQLLSILAQQRIFKGRYINFMRETGWRGFPIGDGFSFALWLKHHLDLLISNNDFLHFADVMEHTLINALHLPVNHSILSYFVEVAVESCYKMQEALKHESKPGHIQGLFDQHKETLFLIGVIIMYLLKQSDIANSPENPDGHFAKKLVHQILALPVVTHPVLGYKFPLSHIAFRIRRTSLIYHEHARYRYALLRMFLDAGVDVHETDNNGNTLLHAAVSLVKYDAEVMKDIVQFLLEKGIHVHARNKFKRKTAMDILKEAETDDLKYTPLKNLLIEYDRLKTLKCIAALKLRRTTISYTTVLPEALIRFLNLH